MRIEKRFTGESTLDEPVSATIVGVETRTLPVAQLTHYQMRDLRSIYTKLLQVLYPPKGGHSQALRWVLSCCVVQNQLTSQGLGSLGTARHLPLARHHAVDRREWNPTCL